MIENPILPGFHPDPSILRVGDDYFIAVSTFEWFPGVLIYHSRDLAHWRFLAAPLRRVSQLDLRGIPNGCGIFAPCLSFCDGLFYLVYTVVKTDTLFQDTDNYLVTAEVVDGEWSEPIYLNSTGFDPSLFHDADGRKWLVNRDCDTRPFIDRGRGILLREYDPAAQRLMGKEYRIYTSTRIVGAEGPHLYRHEGYYYLMLAEGGTDTNHVVTVARSRQLTGPYQCDPCTPTLSSRDDPCNPLQKAGHASLVKTQGDQWYIAHLAGRPIPSKGACVMGRETALQKVCWTDDGWLRLADGGLVPRSRVPAPDLPPCPFPPIPGRIRFGGGMPGYPFQTLRVPLTEALASTRARPGHLRLYGRDSLHSKYEQALIARRQQHFCFTARTAVDFNPANHHQTAGLICLYDTDSFYYLYLTRDDEGIRRVSVLESVLGSMRYPMGPGYEIAEGRTVLLTARVDYDVLRFAYQVEGAPEQPIDHRFDYAVLSDEYAIARGRWRFTGAFVGICCQDCFDRTGYADFAYFEYV